MRTAVRNMMRLTMVVVMLATVSSCSRKVTELTASSTLKKDSLVYVETVRIDTLRLAAEQVEGSILLECDSLGRVQAVADAFRNGRASVTVRTKGNTLTVTANCDSLERLLVMKDTRLRSISETAESLLHSKEVRINCETHWLYKAAAWVAAFYLILTLLWVLWKLFRTYLKAQIPFLP